MTPTRSGLALGLALAALGGSMSVVPGVAEADDVAAVVEGLIELVRENYVLEERVGAIEERLRAGLESGEYGLLRDPRLLAARLMEDLRRASGDQHFGMRPRPAEVPPGPVERSTAARPSPRPSTPGAAPPATPPAAPMGLGRIAVLEGNVGHLEIRAFPDPAVGAAAADAALAELAETDALILDLRASRGGHPGMVAHLFSYFFAGEPFLFNRIHWRNTGETMEFHTRAELPSPRYTGREVFVLTSSHTPSAAEGFTYHLQQFGRATVVGERTAGAAHLARVFELGAYQVAIPTGRPVSPATGGNWEGNGVRPDVAVPAAEALDAAHRLALERLEAGPEG